MVRFAEGRVRCNVTAEGIRTSGWKRTQERRPRSCDTTDSAEELPGRSRTARRLTAVMLYAVIGHCSLDSGMFKSLPIVGSWIWIALPATFGNSYQIDSA